MLQIFSPDVLQKIKDSDSTWEDMVPAEVAEVIKQRRLFGYSEAEMGNEGLMRAAKIG